MPESCPSQNHGTYKIQQKSTNETYRTLIDVLSGHPILKTFLAGSISGTCSTVLFQPLDLVKTKLQNATQTKIESGRINPVISHVLKDENVLSLWRGTTASLIRCVPGVGLYFCTLNIFQTKFCGSNSPDPIQAISFGVLARSFTGAVLIPVTVIKTRYESGIFSYKSIPHAIRHTYAIDGAKGLVCGLAPTLVRDAPFSGLYYMFYTQLKTIVPSPSRSAPSPVLTFLCGLTSGLLASFVTHPADVIKTKMQLYPKQFPNIFSTFFIIVNEKGFTGLFSGLLPRMIRRTLVASMSWTVYEQIMVNFGLKD